MIVMVIWCDENGDRKLGKQIAFIHRIYLFIYLSITNTYSLILSSPRIDYLIKYCQKNTKEYQDQDHT